MTRRAARHNQYCTLCLQACRILGTPLLHCMYGILEFSVYERHGRNLQTGNWGMSIPESKWGNWELKLELLSEHKPWNTSNTINYNAAIIIREQGGCCALALELLNESEALIMTATNSCNAAISAFEKKVACLPVCLPTCLRTYLPNCPLTTFRIHTVFMSV